MAKNQVKITFAGDSKSLETALDRLNGSTVRTSNTLKQRFVKGAKVASAALLGGLVVGAKSALDAASNLNEEVSKTGVVFGKSSKDILNWSKGSAKSMGISRRAALEATGTFGNMLVPMGLAEPKAAKMSKAMVQLAGDMASFNNASPEETLAALRSGLAGETEPLRRFGVFLDAARVKAEAMAMGISDGTKELTAAQKAQATYSLIMKDSTKAQGDFARTSDSAANKQRIQAATVEDLKAKLGQGLLPAYEKVLGIINSVITAASNHTTITKVAIGVVASLATAILGINVAMKAFATAQLAVNAAMNANPAVRIATIIAALGAAIVIAYQKSETFRRIVHGAFGTVARAAQGALSVINGVVGAIKGVLTWLGILDNRTRGTKDRVVANFRDIQSAAASASRASNSVAPSNFTSIGSLMGFHTGGVVPGPVGQETVIRALGGERISRIGERGGGGNSYSIVVNALDPRSGADAVVRAIDEYERQNGRKFARA